MTHPMRVGSFVIERLIGEGTTGRVYRAHDTELDRVVAIKALAPELASDPELLATITAEARALAAVNHPNIETVHGLVRSEDGTRYIVLEYLDGERLSDRLGRGAMPFEEAIRAGIQIASALEAAHERGLIHRDLKPGNIMVTAAGRIKVLDFGLARRSRPRVAKDVDTGTATTWEGTHAAACTPGYASPEQMRGTPHDRRTDLFAFGSVLFECLTGRRAFAGTSLSETVTAVFSGAPDWGLLPRETPVTIRELLERCLRKDASQRLRDAGDARLVLEDSLAEAGAGSGRGSAGIGGRLVSAAPIPSTKIVGRRRELADCRRLLERSRLLVLTGPGGSGKTRLALALAEGSRASYPDGICFVDLAPLVEAERVPHAVAIAAGVRESPDRPVAETLGEVWRGSRVLLLLDNCEHLLDSCAALLGSLLAATESLHILATSREPFHVAGEQVYPVPPLTVAPRRNGVANRIEKPSEAALLFAERASAASPEFELTPKNLGIVEEICASLDGLPLAIELAAARVRVLGLDQIRARLPDRFQFLKGTRRGTARHQTLRGVLDWSYDLLAPEERSFFRALAVFSGGFTLDAAAAAGGVDEMRAIDRLDHLVDKSMVTPPGASPRRAGAARSGPRFQLLETMRQYAADRLEEAGEGAAARDRHLDYYLEEATRASAELTGPNQHAALDRLEADHENLLAALAWCDRAEEGAHKGVRLSGSLWRFWLARGHFSLGRTLLGIALSRVASGEPSPEQGEALLGAGALAFHQNDWEGSEAHYAAALRVMEATRSEEGFAHIWSGLANVAMGRRDYPEAKALYQKSLDYFERAGHARGKGVVLSNLGRVAELEGKLEEARDLYEEGLVIFEEIGDSASSAVRLSSFAELCLKLGDLDTARERLASCLERVRSLDEKRAGAYALERTAALAERVEDPGTAVRFCGASNALRLRIASPLTPAEATELEDILGRAREALGPDFEAAWTAGRALSFEDALDEALAWLGSERARTRTPGKAH